LVVVMRMLLLLLEVLVGDVHGLPAKAAHEA
jgi:hypothetical protein